MVNKEKVKMMKVAGEILARTFDHISEVVSEGINASQIDDKIKLFIESNNASPGFLGYQGYKYSSCISKNEEIVHGIPSHDKVFFDGDIVSIDIGVKYKGYYADAARTFLVGNVSEEAKFLVKITEESFFKSMEGIKEGSRLGDISHGIQKYVEDNGLTVVKDLYSHGIGKSLHEDPLIPNYGKKNSGMVLKSGMTMAINMGMTMGKTMPEAMAMTLDRVRAMATTVAVAMVMAMAKATAMTAIAAT